MTGEARPPLDADYAAGMATTMQALLGIANTSAARQSEASSSIPLTVVTGFLGAGKTTLLNNVLADPGGRRIAVVVNDFGAVEVDAALVRERSASAISLSNGCVCCNLAAGLAATLGSLATQVESLDAMLLETSGIAEPAPIVHAAMQQPEIRLNAILGVLDCERTPALLGDTALQSLMGAQVGCADIVLLNKEDVASRHQTAETERWARATAHPRVRLLRTTHARLPPDLILGESRRRSFLLADDGLRQHDTLFEAFTLEHEGALNKRRLARWMDGLPVGVLRAKGIVMLADAPGQPVAVQVAGRRWSLVYGAAAPASEADRSRMVVIGRRGTLEVAALHESFAWCGVAAAPSALPSA